MARISVATDNFNRSDGALGANWTADPNDEGASPVVVSNTCRNNANNQDGGSFWGADSFNDDQYSKVQQVQLGNSGTTYLGLLTRATTDDKMIHQKDSGNNVAKIWWWNGGSYTAIASASHTFADNKEWIAEAEGTTFRFIVDGSTIASGSNGSAPASGAPGVSTNQTTDIIDNWEGGYLGELPTTGINLRTLMGAGT